MSRPKQPEPSYERIRIGSPSIRFNGKESSISSMTFNYNMNAKILESIELLHYDLMKASDGEKVEFEILYPVDFETNIQQVDKIEAIKLDTNFFMVLNRKMRSECIT